MGGLDLLISHAVPFTLVLFRIAGLFIAAPMLSGTAIPMRAKALASLALACAVYPGVMGAVLPTAEIDLFSLLPLIVIEIGLGMAIGLIASVPLVSLEVSGVLVGQQMGFGLARVYNPESDFDSDILGRLLFYIAAGVYISLGGIDVLFTSLASTFERIPAGGLSMSDAPLDVLVAVLGSGFELAMRVAAPATGIIFLLVLLFGVIGKTMPQINMMGEGFAIKIVAGLGMIAASAVSVDTAAREHVGEVLGLIAAWCGSLGGQ